MPPSESSLTSKNSSRSSAPTEAKRDVLYTLRERVDVEAGERMLASAGMRRLREDCEPYWQSVCNTLAVAKATGGYVTVVYSRPSGCPDYYGRMKANVAVQGVPCTPYVRMVRDARATMAGAHYVDVDMVNCQPAILAQKLRMHDVPCPLLDGYVTRRAEAIAEVSEACGVDRDAAKNLFIRLMYFGGTAAWANDHAVDPETLPPWVDNLKAEMHRNAEGLMGLPELQEFRAAYGRSNASMKEEEGGIPGAFTSYGDAPPIASVMARYLQSAECDCVRALVDAVVADGRAVGGIIYDGVLVERDADRISAAQISGDTLRRWACAVQRKTGLVIELAVKKLTVGPEWAESVDEPRMQQLEELWMKGNLLLSYEDMKRRWESRAFKIVKSGNYVREEVGARDVFSDRMLSDSYKHLHYAVFKELGALYSVTRQPFIARWTKDPRIKSYKDMVLMPPPMVVPPDTYNIWNGFAVERYVPPADRKVDVGSEAVRAYLDLICTLFGHREEDVKYFLDWIAQIFQQPSVKTGIAVLLVGCEGAGKNRATDLLRLMMGSKDRFLQTASPANTLFGRFNSVREGKILVVINESSGSDNFAANDLIKDMITCDEFVSEGKNTNSYAIACFARFIFTTNNENCLKVSPDSRRFFIKEVSSALKGNHDYFRKLSAHIDDEHGRYEFYRLLMDRDISGIDWINGRPVTDYMLSMIDLNLPLEHQFVKETVVKAFHASTDPPVETMMMETIFRRFMDWLVLRNGSAVAISGMNSKKFGLRLSKLVWTADANTIGFKGITKRRVGAGISYTFDVAKLADEMVDKRWAAADEFERTNDAHAFVEDDATARDEDGIEPNHTLKCPPQ